MNRNNRVFRYVLGWLLTAVMVLGCFTAAPISARADQWTDWASLFADSGWYDSEDEKQEDTKEDTKKDSKKDGTVSEDGTYTSKEEVAAYIHEFGHLPDNYITKNEAKDLGWESNKGNLDKVAPGKSIGGDRFGNYEGQLPEKKGRKYYECDIDYSGGYRDAKRIIFSNDGLIYYTEDHYTTFEQLY